MLDGLVVVVGSGNAGFCAAHAAREQGARVLILEKAPADQFGGNSYFTAGAFRVAHGGLADVRQLVEGVDDRLAERTELAPYSRAEFKADLERITEGRCDEKLARTVVDDSADAVRWLRRQGLRFRLMYDRQAYEVEGRHRFWGGLAIGTVDGGRGLVEQHLASARRHSIDVVFGAGLCGLAVDGSGAICGVRYRQGGQVRELVTRAVVLASGGFEANPELRARELGPEWAHAKVRGTRHNTGEVLEMALELGAERFGQWHGCHAIAWDAGAPPSGDRTLTNRLSRQSYPLGIVVNRRGDRFIDEGADFRNYTYAKYGAEILKQPGGVAYQLFDAKTASLLRQDEYASPGASRVEAASIGQLARLIDMDPAALEATVDAFNDAVQPGAFDPSVKDRKHTEGVHPPKSNWASPLDTPPFLAFPVTCGITFTFGGVRVGDVGDVISVDGHRIPGLYAAGELVGGLFHFNYPGGSGLTAGTVLGRRAGRAAARLAITHGGPAARRPRGDWVGEPTP